MESIDIRWQQRLANYLKALGQMANVVAIARERPLSEIEKQALIKTFEFSYELAWNVMKDYFEFQGNAAVTGSRDAIREAFQHGLIRDGEGWMAMLRNRNRTSHTYNEAVAEEIAGKIVAEYFPLFVAFRDTMLSLQAANG